MSESLQNLLAVQDLDLALDQLRHRLGHLPEREELSRIDAEMRTLRQELADLDVSRSEVGQRRAKAETELAATESRSVAVDQRLYGGGVSASRDLQAMAAELEQLKMRASALEDAVLEQLELGEPLDRRAGELDRALEELTARRSEVAARMAEAESALDHELAATGERREAAAGAVPAPLLATYERLRSRLGGVGVARLVGNHCDGCHLTLSAVELDQVRHLAEGQVYSCEQCGRILVP